MESLLQYLRRFRGLHQLYLFDEKIKRNSGLLYAFLLLYGAGYAFYLVGRFNTIPADMISPTGDYCYLVEYMSVRQDWLNAFIAEMRQSGLYTQLARFYDHNGAYYLYLTALGVKKNLFAWQLFLASQMVAGGVLIAAYPSLTYKATRSLGCALIAPIWMRLFMTDILLMEKTDSYWMLYWIVCFSVPILFALATQKWRRGQYIWLGILLLGISLSNLPRAHAGIGALAAVIIILCVKLWPRKTADGKRGALHWLRLPITLCAVLLSYSLFTSIIPSAYQCITKQPPTIGSLGPGHALYVGVGWEDNPFGIIFLDTCGFEATGYAGNDDSNSMGNSPIYDAAITKLYIELLRENPAYFVGTYARKLLACVRFSASNSKTVRNFVLWKMPRFALLAAAGVILSLLTSTAGRKKRLLCKLLCLFGVWLCVFAGSLLPGMIAVPRWTYLNGGIGAFDMLIYMFVILLLSHVYGNLLDIGKCHEPAQA